MMIELPSAKQENSFGTMEPFLFAHFTICNLQLFSHCVWRNLLILNLIEMASEAMTSCGLVP